MKPRLFVFGMLGVALVALPALATGPIVPEPGSATLLGAAALAGVLVLRLRNRR
jgi:hypothetical protein